MNVSEYLPDELRVTGNALKSIIKNDKSDKDERYMEMERVTGNALKSIIKNDKSDKDER